MTRIIQLFLKRLTCHLMTGNDAASGTQTILRLKLTNQVTVVGQALGNSCKIFHNTAQEENKQIKHLKGVLLVFTIQDLLWIFCITKIPDLQQATTLPPGFHLHCISTGLAFFRT